MRIFFDVLSGLLLLSLVVVKILFLAPYSEISSVYIYFSQGRIKIHTHTHERKIIALLKVSLTLYHLCSTNSRAVYLAVQAVLIG